MDKVKHLMTVLELTEEEALQLIADDEKIDKGEKLFELTAEQKKSSKTARQVARAVNAYGKTVIREKKVDEDKREIINLIAETVENLTDEGTVYINNPEREIEFVKGNKKYKVVLSCPRS